MSMRPTDQLSGGNSAWRWPRPALEPDLLLLDEPTANLDSDGAQTLRESLARILEARPLTLILVEHRVAEWLPLVTRVVVMAEGGGILLDGPPTEVFVGHDELLTRHGIWTPDHAGRRPPRPVVAPTSESLIAAEQLSAHPPWREAAVLRLDLTVRAAEALASWGRTVGGPPSPGCSAASSALSPAR
jgi:energy-coupling factor transport system ATP-binding protein